MIQTTIQNLLDSLRDRDIEGYRLYVVKNDDDVLYVGQSSNIRGRIRSHTRSKTPFGQAFKSNRLQSQQWKVDLYTVDECTDLIKRYFPHAPKTAEYPFDGGTRLMEDFAEDALIHDLAPRYNQTINIMFHPFSTPYTKREVHSELQAHWETQRREKEEEEKRKKQEWEEKNAFLVNSVCTICGEHDKWTYSDGQPCGVIDYKVILLLGEEKFAIPLVCHDCNDIINMMNELKRKADVVRKIEAAIAARSIAVPN